MTTRGSVAIAAAIFMLVRWLSSDSLFQTTISPIVRIKNGTLEGNIMKSRKGREIFAFRGIPFAQPPIGKLRFEPPQPSDAWNDVRSAKAEPNECTQRNILAPIIGISGDEDCLYLNVYTPRLPSNETDASQTKYPVMVYLHGGGWVIGTSNFYGPKFLLDHNIVFVTTNYRLGPLGFFSTEDMVTPGNQALKDQSQALRWVQENVAAFGGDPNSVTIFGGSTGAASVHHHVISPLSRGLFHRAISHSGTALNPWAISPRPGYAKRQAKRLGKLFDCPTESSAALVDCLRTKNAVELIATDHDFQIFDYCPMVPFMPVVEPDHPGAFIKEDPAQSLKSGNFADVPWMTGLTSQEGALKAAGVFGRKDAEYVRLFNDKFTEVSPISFQYEHTCSKELKDNVTMSIREFYLGDKKLDESTKWEFIDMFTDAFFFIGADNAIRAHLEALSSPVFYYFFAYRGSTSLSIIFGDPDNDYGVSHGDDHLYLFPLHEYMYLSFSNEDFNMVDLITTLVVNFAKSGNPTPEVTPEIPVKWKPVRTSKLEYLHIENPKKMNMDSNLFADRVKFWASIPHRETIHPHHDLQHDKDEL